MVRVGLHHLDLAAEIALWQHRRGGYAFFEHPPARSWQEAALQRLKQEGFTYVERDMCQYGLNIHGKGPNKKATGIFTHSWVDSGLLLRPFPLAEIFGMPELRASSSMARTSSSSSSSTASSSPKKCAKAFILLKLLGCVRCLLLVQVCLYLTWSWKLDASMLFLLWGHCKRWGIPACWCSCWGYWPKILLCRC